MSKFIYLLNPVRRGKRRRTTKARRRLRRRYSNPVKTRKRRHRSRRRSFKAFSFRRRTHRRHRRRRNPIFRRRRGRRNGGGGIGSPLAAAKQLVSKDTLLTAGGAVLGGLATSYIFSRFGPTKLDATGKLVMKGTGEFKLPLSDSRFGPLVYSLLIPVVGAVALRRAQPQLARGLIIGGAVLLIQNVVTYAQSMGSGSTSGVKSYLNTGGTLRALPTPGYSALRAFGQSLDSGSAFRSNTWAIAR